MHLLAVGGVNMEILRTGMKAPIATDWVTVADIGGGDGTATGTTIISSATMALITYDLPDLIDLMIEIRFRHQLISGTGGVLTWAKLPMTSYELEATQAPSQKDMYTHKLISATADTPRKILIRKPLIEPMYSGAYSRFHVLVEARGEFPDAIWAVTDIKSRLIYVPL